MQQATATCSQQQRTLTMCFTELKAPRSQDTSRTPLLHRYGIPLCSTINFVHFALHTPMSIQLRKGALQATECLSHGLPTIQVRTQHQHLLVAYDKDCSRLEAATSTHCTWNYTHSVRALPTFKIGCCKCKK
jgi:hypothetical protein